MKTVLTIAGSDCSGGAGIQADLKTMTMNGVYGMSVITALTAQNTTGVSGILNVSPEFVGQQIDAVFTDIRPDAVKIGMVSSGEIVHVIAEKLKKYQAELIVVDPVMVATSGSKLIGDDAMKAWKEELFPLATVLTPNIPEAEILAGYPIHSEDDMVRAAIDISAAYSCSVLLKGGHQTNDANDLLCVDGNCQWFYGHRIDNPNTHGTGCTLSSAIAANLAKEYSLQEAVKRAKEYISGALGAMLDLGSGSGPMNHMFSLMEKEKRTPCMDEWLQEAKKDESAPLIGMYLTHNGVVRQSAKAKVRLGAVDTKPVTGMYFSYDQEKVDAAIADTYKMEGIYSVRVWLNEGYLHVGDDLMYVLIGGDIRPHVLDGLQYLVGRIKNECVKEQEDYREEKKL